MRFRGLFLFLAVLLAALVQSVFGAAIGVRSDIEMEDVSHLPLTGTVYLALYVTDGPHDKFHWGVVVQPDDADAVGTLYHAVNPKIPGAKRRRDSNPWEYEVIQPYHISPSDGTVGFVELGRIHDLSAIEPFMEAAAGHIPHRRVDDPSFSCKAFVREVTMRLLNSPTALSNTHKRIEDQWDAIEYIAVMFGTPVQRHMYEKLVNPKIATLELPKGVYTLLLGGATTFTGQPAAQRGRRRSLP